MQKAQDKRNDSSLRRVKTMVKFFRYYKIIIRILELEFLRLRTILHLPGDLSGKSTKLCNILTIIYINDFTPKLTLDI